MTIKKKKKKKKKKAAADRKYDLVLYGASGFTGRQTVEYCRQFAPSGLRWAIAGRNRAKLDSVNSAAVDVLVADARDDDALNRMAGQACVVATTAGPFSPLWHEAGRCLRAQSHSLLRHHGRDALGASPDRSASRASAGRWHADRSELRFRFNSIGLRGLADRAAYQRGAEGRSACACRRTSGCGRGFNGGTLASYFNLMETGHIRDRARSLPASIRAPEGAHVGGARAQCRSHRMFATTPSCRRGWGRF